MPIFDISRPSSSAAFFVKIFVSGLILWVFWLSLLGTLGYESMRFHSYEARPAAESHASGPDQMTTPGDSGSDFAAPEENQRTAPFLPSGLDFKTEGATHFVSGSNTMLFLILSALSLFVFFASHAQRATDAGQPQGFGFLPFSLSMLAIFMLSLLYLEVFVGKTQSPGKALAFFILLFLLFIPSAQLGFMRSCNTCRA